MAPRGHSVEPAHRAYQVVALTVGRVRAQVEADEIGPLVLACQLETVGVAAGEGLS